jgi:hypothetical protein
MRHARLLTLLPMLLLSGCYLSVNDEDLSNHPHRTHCSVSCPDEGHTEASCPKDQVATCSCDPKPTATCGGGGHKAAANYSYYY